MLSEPQHEQARALANKRRSEIAEVRASVAALGKRDGMLKVAELLRDPSPPVQTMKAFDLLDAVKWLHRWHISEILHDAGVRSKDRRVRQLTERQRKTIAWDLRCHAEKVGRK